MKDGRRQLLPPKQLVHPGAAARLATTIARHTLRHMSFFSSSVCSVAESGVVRDAASET
jgi:hypothetical protein